MNSYWLIEEYIFANDFLRFFDRSFKKTLKVMYFPDSDTHPTHLVCLRQWYRPIGTRALVTAELTRPIEYYSKPR